MKMTGYVLGGVWLALIWALPSYGWSSGISSDSAVTVAALQVNHGVASGVLINNAQGTVRDVKLLVREQWYWRNEFRPGAESPGRSGYVTIDGAIPPGGRFPFSFEVEPNPARADGHFETEVEVVAYTEISR